MQRLLVLLPATTYRAHDVLQAAGRLGLNVVVGCDRRQALESVSGGTTLTIPFSDPAVAARVVTAAHAQRPIEAVVGLDDETVLIAAQLAEHLGFPGNSPAAVRSCQDKLTLRRVLAAAGVRGPRFRAIATHEAAATAENVGYPCVLKPTFLSASRGVIRADTPSEFTAAAERIAEIIRAPDLRERPGHDDRILVEDYLPGNEIAVDAMIRNGQIAVVATFDKPDPLIGPYFEETLYVTPSRHPPALLAAAHEQVAVAARAVGLRSGPLHAELRIHEDQATLLELAPRPVGGLCPRIIDLAFGISLEELVLRAAVGQAAPAIELKRAAGVMMLPIPRSGILREVHGLDVALAVPGVTEVTISIARGQHVVALPEGDRYLGFLFATGERPDDVERALRAGHRELSFRIA